MMHCRRWPCVLLLTAAALMPSRSEAETFQVLPAADAFVSSANPANNYGGGGAFTISAPGLPSGEFQSLLRFDLAAARDHFDATFGSGNWLPDSAALQLTAALPNNALFNPSAAGHIRLSWVENDSWIEGDGRPTAPGSTGITWDLLPTVLSAADESLGSIHFDGATTGTQSYPLAASMGLADDVLGGSAASILLAAATGDVTVSALFNSRTFNNPASQPRLSITAVAVPEPAAILLVGPAAMAVLLATRFRRHRVAAGRGNRVPK